MNIIGFIYKTTNLVNGKIYIGQHIGKVNDSYLGSGVVLHNAIRKYGRCNFKREILRLCYTEHELTIWVTNGVNNLYIKKGSDIPQGYYKGMIRKKKI